MTKNSVRLSSLLCCWAILQCSGEISIDRQNEESDILNLPDDSALKITSDFKELPDGKKGLYICENPERHAILTYKNDPGKLTCITNTEADKDLGVTCSKNLEVLNTGEYARSTCNIEAIPYVNIWTMRNLSEPWKRFNLTQPNVGVNIVNRTKIVFNSKWDGLLIELYYTCSGAKPKCARFKFPGKRTYPLPNNLDSILSKTTASPTTASPITASPTDDTPVTSSSSSNTGLIIGIVIGCFFVLFFLIGLFFFIRKRKRRYKGDKKNPGSAVYGKCEFDIITKIEYKKDDEESNGTSSKQRHNTTTVPIQDENDCRIAERSPPPTPTQYFEEPEYHSPNEKLLGRPSVSEGVFNYPDNTGDTNDELEPMYSAPECKIEKVPAKSSDRRGVGYSKPELNEPVEDNEPEYSKPDKGMRHSLVENAFDMRYEPNNNPDYYSTPCGNENHPLISTSPTAEYAQVDKSKKNKAVS